MNNTRPRTILLGLLLGSLLTSGHVSAQAAPQEETAKGALLIQQQKEEFVAALKELMGAVEGKFGDEGNKVWSSIASLRRQLDEWDEAIRAFETALASKPPDAETHVALGRVYLDRNRIEEALREFAAASRLDPKRADSHTFQGLAHRHAGRSAEAVQAFRKATALDPEDPTVSYILAQNLLKMGQQEEAGKVLQDFQKFQQERLQREGDNRATASRLKAPFKGVEEPTELLQQVPALGPLFLPAPYSQGFALLKQGKHEQAIVSFKEAAGLDPLSAESLAKTDKPAQELGSLALRQGKLESALNHLRTAVELDPNQAEARRVLGMAYWADGQYDKSIEQLKAAIGLGPRDERPRMALAGVLIAGKQFAEAEQTLKEAIEAIPGSGQAHYNLGRLYYTLARHQEALKKFEQAIEFSPVAGRDQLYGRIGSIYTRQTQLTDAIEAYRKALELSPNDPDAHKRLGELYLQRNRHDEALAEFLAALLIDPQNAEVYAAIGQVHHKAGRYAAAVQASQKALEIDRQHGRARYTLGTALIRLGKVDEGKKELEEFQQMQAEAKASEHRDRDLRAIKQEASASLEKGDYDKAIALLRRAVEREPHLGLPYLSLGIALLKAGQHEEAIQQLQKALERKADSPDVHRHLSEAYKALGRMEESEKEKAIYVKMKEELIRRMGRNP